MSAHRLEDHEDAPLFEAVKAAGQYLDDINIHDLRYLSRDQLMTLGSIVIATFAEERAAWFDKQRHPDDRLFPMDLKPPLDAAGNVIRCGPDGEVVEDAVNDGKPKYYCHGDLDDEIPF